MGVEEHRQAAEESFGAIPVALVTVSDSRTAATDVSGPLMRGLVEQAGHQVVSQTLIPNDPERVRAVLREFLASPARCLVFSGGTGLGRRDVTLDTVRPLFEKELDGFGELFRWLSYQEIGAAAILSRAAAGACQGRLVVCLPGSSAAVRLAFEKLLLPELRHVVRELGR